jgi:acyl-CoA dehydrogenase
LDFKLDDSQIAVRDLARQILDDRSTPERLRALEADGVTLDRELWSELANAGLIGIGLPEEYGGGGLGFVEVGLLLTEAGRHTAKLPLLPTITTGQALSEFGPAELAAEVLPGVCEGQTFLTAALSTFPDPPLTAGSDGAISGSVSFVPAGMAADRILVFVDGAGAFLLDPAASGVSREPQLAADGSVEARLTLEGVSPLARLNGDAAAIREWLRLRTTAGLCTLAAGITEIALDMTTEYARERQQFGKPIASFQAVAQRAADGFIDVKAIRLSALSACWRVASGLPSAEAVAVAKFWAADGGRRVLHAAQHIHGGIGVDRDYPLHRYFLAFTQCELTLGGASEQLLRLGDELAAVPA